MIILADLKDYGIRDTHASVLHIHECMCMRYNKSVSQCTLMIYYILLVFLHLNKSTNTHVYLDNTRVMYELILVNHIINGLDLNGFTKITTAKYIATSKSKYTLFESFELQQYQIIVFWLRMYLCFCNLSRI